MNRPKKGLGLNAQARRIKPQRKPPPGLELARLNGMITQEEFDACLRGDMSYASGRLFNVNASKKVTRIPTGVHVIVDVDRVNRLMIDIALGTDSDEL